MCIICVEYAQGRLTAREVIRNAHEVAGTTDGEERDHLLRVIDKAADDEIQSNHQLEIERWAAEGGQDGLQELQ